MAARAYVTFTLNGKRVRLEPVYETAKKKDLFFIFKDLTSQDPRIRPAASCTRRCRRTATSIVDFNLAYNPPCAFTDFATCPLPPQQNQLAVRIEAGEKAYHGSDEVGRLEFPTPPSQGDLCARARILWALGGWTPSPRLSVPYHGAPRTRPHRRDGRRDAGRQRVEFRLQPGRSSPGTCGRHGAAPAARRYRAGSACAGGRRAAARACRCTSTPCAWLRADPAST